VMFCPRAGCGRSASPVRWGGCGNGSDGTAIEAPPDERGGNRQASTLDQRATSLLYRKSPYV